MSVFTSNVYSSSMRIPHLVLTIESPVLAASGIYTLGHLFQAMTHWGSDRTYAQDSLTHALNGGVLFLIVGISALLLVGKLRDSKTRPADPPGWTFPG